MLGRGPAQGGETWRRPKCRQSQTGSAAADVRGDGPAPPAHTSQGTGATAVSAKQGPRRAAPSGPGSSEWLFVKGDEGDNEHKRVGVQGVANNQGRAEAMAMKTKTKRRRRKEGRKEGRVADGRETNRSKSKSVRFESVQKKTSFTSVASDFFSAQRTRPNPYECSLFFLQTPADRPKKFGFKPRSRPRIRLGSSSDLSFPR